MNSGKIEHELLCAAWVAPMNRPPIRDGAVVIGNGRVLDVGKRADLSRRHSSAKVVDLGQSALLPGLVNAHTHLELSDCECGTPPAGGFASWLAGMLRRTRLPDDEMRQAVIRAVDIGVRQSIRFGVTTLGDISRQCQITRGLLRESALRVVSFGEVQAMAQRRGLLEERLAIAADEKLTGPRLTIGITPHAPYSVEPVGYQRCLEVARKRNLPLATHLAETKDESTFLESHSGPLRDLWDQWLTWDEDVPKFAGGPIRMARNLGLLDYATLLAHVNYCDDEEMEILARSKASVVYCPRTHQFFGHPPHRWREMISRGINVAVGTDSCASSPDLNLVEELRVLHRIAPEIPAAKLWEMGTIRAGRAIGLDGAGVIQTSAFADLVAFKCANDDFFCEILERQTAPSHVWADGRKVL